MSKKRVIVHIGLPKTGTTSLQYYLKNDNEKPNEIGVGYYSSLVDYVPWKSPANGGFLLAYILHELKEPKDPKKQKFLKDYPSLDIVRLSLDEEKYSYLEKDKESFKEYAKMYDTLIFSEECLWHYEIFFEDYFECVKKFFLECFEEEPIIQICLYLRRQDEWMESKWREDVQNKIPHPLDFHEDLKVYEDIGWLDYASSVKRIEKVFGKENVIVRDFNREKLVGNDIVYDFFDAMQIPLSIEEIGPTQRFNNTISNASAYALCYIKKKSVQTNESLDPISLLYANTFFTKIFDSFSKPTHLLSHEEIKELLDKYGEGNRYLGDQYNHGQPFFDTTISNIPVFKKSLSRDKRNARLIRFFEKHIIFMENMYSLYTKIRKS